MFDKLDGILERFDEILEMLNDPSVANDQNNFRKLMKEQSDLAPIVEAYKTYKQAKQDVEDSLLILDEENDEDGDENGEGEGGEQGDPGEPGSSNNSGESSGDSPNQGSSSGDYKNNDQIIDGKTDYGDYIGDATKNATEGAKGDSNLSGKGKDAIGGYFGNIGN